MLNGSPPSGMLRRLERDHAAGTRGASIPWAVFQRGLAVGLISQATWWGAITIGFLTTAAGKS